MRAELIRYADNGTSCLGLLYLEGDFMCYTLEDTARQQKVKGKTCIPEGSYPALFREVLSPLTEEYRNQYDWFSYHIELKGVPGFKYVYIHIGNYATDTEGCILVGSGSTEFPERMITNSREAYKALYNRIKDSVSRGNFELNIRSL